MRQLSYVQITMMRPSGDMAVCSGFFMAASDVVRLATRIDDSRMSKYWTQESLVIVKRCGSVVCHLTIPALLPSRRCDGLNTEGEQIRSCSPVTAAIVLLTPPIWLAYIFRDRFAGDGTGPVDADGASCSTSMIRHTSSRLAGPRLNPHARSLPSQFQSIDFCPSVRAFCTSMYSFVFPVSKGWALFSGIATLC